MPGWLSDRINDWHLYEFFAYCIQITLYPAVKVLFMRLADALHPPPPDHGIHQRESPFPSHM